MDTAKIANLKRAVAWLERATKCAEAASSKAASLSPWEVSQRQLGKASDRHTDALRDMRDAEHEVHVCCVEMGLAQPEPDRYGKKITDHTRANCPLMHYRRPPAINY